jgi:hypothetical protein
MALLSCSEQPKTYGRACSNPLPHWRTPEQGWHNVPINRLHIDRNHNRLWNGQPVSGPQLSGYLSLTHTLIPMPATVLTADPQAACTTVEAIRRELERKLQCRDTRACGEGEGEWLNGPNLLSEEEMTPEQRRGLAELEEAADRASEPVEPR